MEQIALICLIIALGVSIYTDVKWYKIKNFITIPAFFIGLLFVFFTYGVKTGLIFLITSFVAGLIPEFFRIWGPGDSKLFISSSLLSVAYLQTTTPAFIAAYFLFHLFIYVVLGHSYVFAKSGFKPLVYITNLKYGGKFGGIPGAIPITVSNLLALYIFSTVSISFA